ncbi:MAG: alpha-2-macroglobulin [Elusimicrobia bacterium]|nr:alpha-2-macroglobulin [Elusimicrobiota bacterium]
MNTTVFSRAARNSGLSGIIPALLILSAPVVARSEARQAATNIRPEFVTETTVIPEHFLRRWDPVTIFFSQERGPKEGGPEDQPERFVTVDTDHPGSYRWLDGRTLQFQPSEPWPSLSRFIWTADKKTTALFTLMEAPVLTDPADLAEGLEQVKNITLTFAEPLDPGALAGMISLELRPLPGVGSAASRWLAKNDFTVKVVERRSRAEKASYVLTLKEPIPPGIRTNVHMRLALADQDTESFRDFSFSTAEPFRVVSLGTRRSGYPITPEGSHYTQEQAIRGDSSALDIVAEFSASPDLADDALVVTGRNLVRFSPAVAKLSYRLEGSRLIITGDFRRDTLYRVSLSPTPVRDQRGKQLEMKGASEVFVYFPRERSYVRLRAGQGIAERFGKQMIPVEGRGEERVDLRIYPLPPLDRSFWPFTGQPLETDDGSRPPGPGEEPMPFSAPDQSAGAGELARQISILGSPPVSALVPLPLKKEGGSASFGLDLTPHLARLSGHERPGAYLIGLRDVAAGSRRSWMRLQVTDLSLTTVEEPDAVRYIVTSLQSAQPVPNARVRVEGTLYDRGRTSWTTLAEGTTDGEGVFRWRAPGRDPSREQRTVRRITVEKDKDLLVLDPANPPDVYYDNQWSVDRSAWLQWTQESLAGRGAQPQIVSHIFTERPMYRPEEEVHIKGYLRKREKGRLTPVRAAGWLIVEGPGEISWKYPAVLTELGSFYHAFSEKDLPTGTYSAHLENQDRTESYGRVTFQLEAYRLPLFEVDLHGPDQTSLDKEFEVKLTASYYAGGKVGGQPVEWRVTQFPLAWTPKKREGFLYSSDGRFSRTERFQASPRLEKQDTTDENGSAGVLLNPALELTAQPRTYLVEATVTGADDQTVSASKSISALPAFVLGLKVPRYIERAKEISPEIIVTGPDDALLAGKEVTVRLLRREWHSALKASDFSDGVARYVTDVVDEKVSENTITSAAEPVTVTFPVPRAGVYIVELEAHDKLDRAQVVRVDLYAGGDERVAWPKPFTRVFTVTPDKAKYDPGMTARIVLQSPFQKARALAIVETPDGNKYQWLDVDKGVAVFSHPIEGNYAPRLPVHFILMRGRLAGAGPAPAGGMDAGKPETMAATAWLDVNPLAQQLKLALEYPPVARPGEKIKVAVSLKDPSGGPLSGEVTLWLVDQAVLSLGKEQRLDPVPDFIRQVNSFLKVHDSRNLALGSLPFAENPGGDEGAAEPLLDKVTVRKNFKTVPYYNPLITIGPDGKAVVEITLSDDLTNFKLRAKAAAGPERFGYAVGHLAVRLPLIVQPALPRFVRPGDVFTAAAISRIVEGHDGPGQTEYKVQGLKINGPAKQDIQWTGSKPLRIEFPVEAASPAYTAEGRPALQDVTFTVGVRRNSDNAKDAFEVRLPLREDRGRVSKRMFAELKSSEPLVIAAVEETVRPGTLTRSVLLSDQPGLIKMAAGLDFFMHYPYGCTEQQLSRARVYMALRKFRTLLKQEGSDREMKQSVSEVLNLIPTVIDGDGQVAFWPGSRGYVSLTAWTLQFLVEAKEAGFTIDEKILGRLTNSLERALRSDYSRFIDGESFAERVWALLALTRAGKYNSAYAAELARKAQFLNLESIATVLYSFALAEQDSSTAAQLEKALWDGIVVRLYQGREMYGGLQEKNPTRNDLILPTETRTIAQMTRAVARYDAKNQRLPLLVDSLVTLGQDDGWGTTNANAEALLALSEILRPPYSGAKEARVRVTLDGKEQTIRLGPDLPLGFVSGTGTGAGEAVLQSNAGPRPIAVRVDTSYIPAEDGSRVAAQSSGFVVTRELLLVRKDAPPVKFPLTEAGTTQTFAVGDVVEEHVQVVNPKERHYVAVSAPLAAGMEPLNPDLRTAAPEAAPAGNKTLSPPDLSYQDDQAAFYYNVLPAGTYDFYFRTRATVAGTFIQPGAKAEMMYDAAVFGLSNGAKVLVKSKAGE